MGLGIEIFGKRFIKERSVPKTGESGKKERVTETGRPFESINVRPPQANVIIRANEYSPGPRKPRTREEQETQAAVTRLLRHVAENPPNAIDGQLHDAAVMGVLTSLAAVHEVPFGAMGGEGSRPPDSSDYRVIRAAVASMQEHRSDSVPRGVQGQLHHSHVDALRHELAEIEAQKRPEVPTKMDLFVNSFFGSPPEVTWHEWDVACTRFDNEHEMEIANKQLELTRVRDESIADNLSM